MADKSLSVILLRYFNPAGAHESGLIGENPLGIPNNLMPHISLAAMGKTVLKVFGDDYPTPDGTGVRDYLHVCDLAEGHIAALRFAEKHSGVEAFNLGSGSGFSVKEIITAFEKANGVKVPFETVARRPGDIPTCYTSTKKAKDLLGWTAKHTMEDICRDEWNRRKGK